MRSLIPLFIIISLMAICGCSGGGDNSVLPTAPGETARPAEADNNTSHITWGMYTFYADMEAQTLEAVPLRVADVHLNALPFLEPPPLVLLTLESLEFDGNIIEADIGLRHPFLGLTEFTGFDVSGILISNGTMTGFNDPDIVMAGNEEDTFLMNPDGYSAWWNPTNFPVNLTEPVFGYVDGLLGAKDEYAHYNSTVCAYKYFADDLNVNDTLDMLVLANRGLFSPGMKNVRHFTIHVGSDGPIFNYAVDACWQFPEGAPPWSAPESFSISANRPEAFRIIVEETDNDLWFVGPDEKGGSLGLDVHVYDWQGPPTIVSVGLEAPGVFTYTEQTTPLDTTEHIATYHFDLSGDNLTGNETIEFMLITAKDIAEFPTTGGNIPFYATCGGYEVSDESPVEYEDIIFYCADYGVGRNIFSIDPLGEEEPYQWTEQTSTSEWCENPEVSPDGKYVIYLRYSWSGFVSEIRRLEIETGEDISLTGGMTNWYIYGNWRNDGQKIVYSYCDSIFAGDAELYIMDIDGSNKELIATTGLYVWAPQYNPDDNKIVFQSFNDSQLYIYDIATEELSQYTNNGTWNDDPTYSPDGQYIAWATAYGGGGRRIYISPITAWDPPWKIIGFETYIRSPGFNPDGDKVVFDHGGFDGAEIAVYNLTDDTWYDVTSNAWADLQADWGYVKVYD